jgi:branched-chain amino acid transport system permease protein
MDQGKRAPFVITGWIAFATLVVFLVPRNLLAFLLLMIVTPGLLFRLHTTKGFKIGATLTFLFFSVSVAGARNLSYFDIAFLTCAFAALALGLNIVVGFAGLLDLGYIAFYAIGAYSWAFFGSQQLWKLEYAPGAAPAFQGFPLPTQWFWVILVLAPIATGLAGVLLGTPVLRVRGDYLAIVTLAFGEVIRVLALNLDKPINLTNGPQGITPIQRPPLPPDLVTVPIQAFLRLIAGPAITQNQLNNLTYNLIFYALALGVMAFAILLTVRLDNSRLGRSWMAIREDETAAVAMGIPLVRTKLLAFAIGASFAGGMGVLVASFRSFVSPDSFTVIWSILILSMVILGGIGSIPGSILGAAILTFLIFRILPDIASLLSSLRQSSEFWGTLLPPQLDPAQYQRLILGLVLVIMMIYRPAGLLPAQRRKMELEEEADDTSIDPPESLGTVPAATGPG